MPVPLGARRPALLGEIGSRLFDIVISIESAPLVSGAVSAIHTVARRPMIEWLKDNHQLISLTISASTPVGLGVLCAAVVA